MRNNATYAIPGKQKRQVNRYRIPSGAVKFAGTSQRELTRRVYALCVKPQKSGLKGLCNKMKKIVAFIIVLALAFISYYLYRQDKEKKWYRNNDMVKTFDKYKRNLAKNLDKNKRQVDKAFQETEKEVTKSKNELQNMFDDATKK